MQLRGGLEDLGYVIGAVLLAPVVLGVGIGVARGGAGGALKGGLIGVGVAAGVLVALRVRSDLASAAFNRRLAECQAAYGAHPDWHDRCYDYARQGGQLVNYAPRPTPARPVIAVPLRR